MEIKTIITCVFYAMLIGLNIGFIAWCIKDTRKFSKKSKQKIDEFDDFCKKSIAAALIANSKKVDDKLVELNDRVDILARENIKLRLLNEYYKDKLHNCGFTDKDLEI